MDAVEAIAMILSAFAASAILAHHLWKHPSPETIDRRQLREAERRRDALGRAATRRPWPEEAHDG
jgi:hypothetical protein